MNKKIKKKYYWFIYTEKVKDVIVDFWKKDKK